WKHCPGLRTAARVSLLLRLVAGEVARRAAARAGGEELFALLERGAAAEAEALITLSLRVCGQLRAAYLECKAAACSECPRDPWNALPEAAIFAPLDRLQARCHALLELAAAAGHMAALRGIQLGGPRGRILTASVAQVHADAAAALAAARDAMLALQAAAADGGSAGSGGGGGGGSGGGGGGGSGGNNYSDGRGKEQRNGVAKTAEAAAAAVLMTYRRTIQALDGRLADAVLQALDDCWTLHGRLRVLDAFGDAIERPAVAAAMEPRYARLASELLREVEAAAALFAAGRHRPPVPANMPPSAGAIIWARGVVERVRLPVQRLSGLAAIANVDAAGAAAAAEASRAFVTLEGRAAEFEEDAVRRWAATVTAASDDALRQPLLVRGCYDGGDSGGDGSGGDSHGDDGAEVGSYVAGYGTDTGGVGSIGSVGIGGGTGGRDCSVMQVTVNFDVALTRLLRETRYLLGLGVDVPAAARELHPRSAALQAQATALELVAATCNDVWATVQPAERPLLRQQLNAVDSLLARGMVTAAGSGGTASAAVPAVSPSVSASVYSTAATGSRKTVVPATAASSASRNCGTAAAAAAAAMTPVTVAAAAAAQRAAAASRLAVLRADGEEIARLLVLTRERLKVSPNLPAWRNYVDYVNDAVVAGLAAAVTAALAALRAGL
ncbi:unnamed protein product, partial [Phaeothamnion confervicola]